MATYFARKSGNINAADVWATTPSGTASDVFSSFTNADTLMANSFTVTVNVNTTVLEVRNDTTGGATTGGSFSLSNGITLTANIYALSASCATLAGTASATIIGAINGGSGTNGYGVNMTGTGTLTITGAITGGTGTTSYGVYTNSNSTINITGNVQSGTGSNAEGVKSDGAASIITITGNITGSVNAIGMSNRSNGTVTIIGTVTASSLNGAYNQGAGTMTITGTAIGAASVGAVNNSTGTLTVVRAKGGPLAASLGGVSGSTNGSTSIEEIEYGDLGASPTAGCIRLTDKTSNVAVMYKFGASKKTLTDPNASGLMPAASNVRFGTIYNGGNSTGSCYVPAASSVAYGVNVDNTTGTAALTPAAVWDYLTSSVSTSGSIGERLKNCSTVASVGQALSNALS